MDILLLRKLLVTSIIGLIIGSIILLYGQPTILKKALGLFIISFVLNTLINKNPKQLSSNIQFVLGIFGGFFSGIFSTGGPLYAIIIKNKTNDVKVFRATMFGILGVVSIIRIAVLIAEGAVTTIELHNSLYVLPFFISALYLGKKVYLKLDEKILKKLILSLLFISGIILIVKN